MPGRRTSHSRSIPESPEGNEHPRGKTGAGANMYYGDAIKQAFKNRKAREYPGASDIRSREGTVFPVHHAKFKLGFTVDQTVFTIGSCFARNIEEALFDRKVFLPTRTFGVPTEEWNGQRRNGILNEYNPGTISQRILFALAGKSLPAETIVPNGELYADLSLPADTDVTMARAIERRAQIDDVYKHLAKSDLVIITLGLVEAWFDEETKLFLNRIPPNRVAEKFPNRFALKRLDVDECMTLLDKAFGALEHLGIRTILTVSPVPLMTTFAAADCVVANEFSKAVLRVCAERLKRRVHVDYFPSYEIVRSCGMPAYFDDQIHVKDEMVHEVTKYMVSVYEGT